MDALARYIADPTLPLPPAWKAGQRLKVAALRSAYQISMASRYTREKLNSGDKVAAFMLPILGALHVERLYVLPLNTHCMCIGEPLLCSEGDIDGTDACVRKVLRQALVAGANTMVVCHNHPTGNHEPSAADQAVTRNIANGGRAIGVCLDDHVVIGGGGFTSMRRDRPGCFL